MATNQIFNSIFNAFTAPYTTMLKLNSISLPDLKMVLRIGQQIVVEGGQIKKSAEIPTNEITMLEGTAANTKFRVTMRNLATGDIEIINL